MDEIEAVPETRCQIDREKQAAERQTGVVKWFDEVRGFGFVARSGEVDLFVHASALAEGERLAPGQRVSFEVAEGRRGLQARKVRQAPQERALEGEGAATSAATSNAGDTDTTTDAGGD